MNRYRPPFRPWQPVPTCDRCDQPAIWIAVARHEPDDAYDDAGDILVDPYGDRPDLGAGITCRGHIAETFDDVSVNTGTLVAYPVRERWREWCKAVLR